MKKALITLLLLAGFNSAQGQTIMSFTNLDGFPDVVADGVAYDLSGYIINTGSDNSVATVDIWMSVNGNAIQLENNFNMGGPLQPGDSVLWVMPNFVFPPLYFMPGHNDLLIWPTSPSSNPNASAASDTLSKDVYLATEAAMRMSRDLVEGMPEQGMEFNQLYHLHPKAVNEGIATTSEPIKFFLTFEKGPVIELGKVTGSLQPGDTAALHLPALEDFNLRDFVRLHTGREYQPRWVLFYAWEKETIPAIESAQFPVLMPQEPGIPGQAGLNIVPNPANEGSISVYLKGIDPTTVTRAILCDAAGKVLMDNPAMLREINTSNLPSGVYSLRIYIGESVLTGKVIIRP